MKFSLAIVAIAALAITNVNADTTTVEDATTELVFQEEDIAHELIQHEQEIIAELNSLHLNRVVTDPAAVDANVDVVESDEEKGDIVANVESGNIVIDFDDEEEGDAIVLDYDKEEGLTPMNAATTPELYAASSSAPEPVLYEAAPEPVLYATSAVLTKHQMHHEEKAKAKAAKDHKEELSMPHYPAAKKGHSGSGKSGGGNSGKSGKTVGGSHSSSSSSSIHHEEKTQAKAAKDHNEISMSHQSPADHSGKSGKYGGVNSGKHHGKASKRGKVHADMSMPKSKLNQNHHDHHAKTYKETERMSIDYNAKTHKGERTGTPAVANTESVETMTGTQTTVAAAVHQSTQPMEERDASTYIEFTEPPDADEALSTTNISDASARTPDAIPSSALEGTNTSGLTGDKFAQEVKDVMIGGGSGGASSESNSGHVGGGHHNQNQNVGALDVRDKARSNSVESEMMRNGGASSSSLVVGGFCLIASSAVAYTMMV
mmetsp:Transcript_4303/g.9746  ORF Transcript_4303/g.9746 Transcript_4303/m.9746 type:complete len:488 (+) Transcript_4303:117-1580(+)|eukprot:CAMPEP_0172311390 /NCGR_PEP_ID=MMETSP1058-20130122/14642_1 /TAXON_ID=83371 /ORGANISM="Detonula confervacea, Strain CCMP 353" /LENGTH=487 /DNA_ID=CAMNT_0013024549 /DNA_START=60 /DNA_END=1523 /DNA_ORIENTATION=-